MVFRHYSFGECKADIKMGIIIKVVPIFWYEQIRKHRNLKQTNPIMLLKIYCLFWFFRRELYK